MGNEGSSYSSGDSDRPRSSWYNDLDSDDSAHSHNKSPSPPAKKPRLELVYETEDEDELDECYMMDSSSYKDDDSTIRIKYCSWTIYDFPMCDVHKDKGIIKSPVYVAGSYNRFQFYFIMEKIKTEVDTFFGVYVCVLSLARSEATVDYKSYIIELKGHKYQLASSRVQKFPRKTGFRFLGSVSKKRIMGDDYWAYRMIPEDDLTLSFKINVQYKKAQNFDGLVKLFENNLVRDVKIIVEGYEFTANKKILVEQSSTFSKLIKKNKNNEKLIISGIEPEIMKQILLYIYTGRVTRLFTYVDKLSIAADKYKIESLKAMCKKVKLV